MNAKHQSLSSPFRGLLLAVLPLCWPTLGLAQSSPSTAEKTEIPVVGSPNSAFPPPPPYSLTPTSPVTDLGQGGTPSQPSPTENAPIPQTGTPVQTLPAAVPPPPYSLPFGLRPIVPVTVLRLDTVFAFYQQNLAAAGQEERWEPGFTSAFLPTIGYKFNPSWMGIFRFGVVGNRPPRITGDEAGADNCEDTTTTDATTGQPKTTLTKCGVASTNMLNGGFLFAQICEALSVVSVCGNHDSGWFRGQQCERTRREFGRGACGSAFKVCARQCDVCGERLGTARRNRLGVHWTSVDGPG